MAGGPRGAHAAQGRAGAAKRGDPQEALELPWVAVGKGYQFDTKDGKKSLADLFEGRSQLLAYNIMFGPRTPVAPVLGARASATSWTGRWFTSTTAT